MNQLISHIEFLLHTHDCVIVPALGGFVVNSTPPQKDGLSVFHSPACELVFNRELAHNDGLLIESYMRVEKISFEKATRKIEDSVREIKNLLRSEKRADLGDLGNFRIVDDQRFVYQPKPFIRPKHFGLSNASLKPIIQVMPQTETAKRTTREKKQTMRKIGIGAAAAAVISAIMFIFPVQDNTLRHQTAQVLSEKGLFSFRAEHNKPDPVEIPSTTTAAETVLPEPAQTEENTFIPQTETTAALADNPTYYIVTGVYQIKKGADNMLSRLHSEGFTTASLIERPNRIDVYTSSYSTREEAEENLKRLKQDFPNHKDAWILKK